MLPVSWSDDNPMFLLIVPLDESDEVVVDLGEKGWIAKLGDRMRAPGTWHLCRKPVGLGAAFGVAFSMAVLEGEQPYYVARHIGSVFGAIAREVICYGMGKKLVDGSTQRGWVLPNGQVAIGDDVELFARGMIPTG